MSNRPTPKELDLLNYIHSLRIVSDNEIGASEISTLLQKGWVRKIWIGNYALTDSGKRARHLSPPPSI